MAKRVDMNPFKAEVPMVRVSNPTQNLAPELQILPNTIFLMIVNFTSLRKQEYKNWTITIF